MWSVECKVRSVECKVWSEECRVWWSVECRVRSVKCKVWSAKWKVWSVECAVESVECKVQSVKCGVPCGASHTKEFSTRYKTGWKSQNATPVLQNDMATCLKTFEKERLCSFPQRHGDATGKPETRDKTRGRSKTSISCETSSNFETFDTLSNRLECHKLPRKPHDNLLENIRRGEVLHFPP